MLETSAPIASWPQGWTVHAFHVPTPVPHEMGKWLLKNRLYAEGNDFTNEEAQYNPDYVGNSLLRRFWRGEKNNVNLQSMGMDLWVLAKEGVPQGVVSWMRSNTAGHPFLIQPTPEIRNHPNHKPRQQIPAASLGVFMLYMKKEHRKAGLMRRTVSEFVAPQVLAQARLCRAQGGFPFIAAKDAAAELLQSVSHVPVVNEMTHCLARQGSIWDFWTLASMWPEHRTDCHEFLMPPVAVTPTKKQAVSKKSTSPNRAPARAFR